MTAELLLLLVVVGGWRGVYGGVGGGDGRGGGGSHPHPRFASILSLT